MLVDSPLWATIPRRVSAWISCPYGSLGPARRPLSTSCDRPRRELRQEAFPSGPVSGIGGLIGD